MTGLLRARQVQDGWDHLVPPVGLEASHSDLDVKTPAGSLRLAKDAENAVHLLIPVADGTSIPTDRSSKGVVLIEQVMQLERTEIRFADLVCSDEHLQPVFSQLVADIVRRIDADPSVPVEHVVHSLQEWRDLFQHIRHPSDSRALGLSGELEVLRNLAIHDPRLALDAWVGPTGSKHDFVSDRNRLEIKTTARRDGQTVTIHGLDQLDPGSNADLHLVFIRVSPDPVAGLTLPERIDELIDMKVPKSGLLDKLELAGYHESERAAWDQSFTVSELSIWRVSQEFPGLRRSRLPSEDLLGVESLTYDLNLTAAGPPLSVTERLEVWEQLAGLS